MKKIILSLLVFAVITGSAFAEFNILSFPPPVEGGNIMIDLGVGLRATEYNGAKWKIPPLFAHVEYALPVGVPISVGGMFAFYQYGYDFWGYSWKWTDMNFAIRGNWHWGLDVKWLDLYTGLSMGYTYSIWSGSNSYGSSNYSGFFYAVQGGAHFYFTKYFGAIAEVGYPYWIKAGLAFKF
jgi:hypothetical protein